MRPFKFQAIALLLAVAACSTMPNAGPTTSEVLEQATKPQATPFTLVELSSAIVAAAASQPVEALHQRFRGKPPPPTIGVGDSVAIMIWQAGVSGLSEPTPSAGIGATGSGSNGNGYPSQIVLPDQLISMDGGLSVPFAGRIKAIGRTPFAIQRTIEQALSQHFIEPQALVTVPRSGSNTATVSGEALGGMRVPLSAGGDRLLDIIAAAGGPKSALYDTEVRLNRHGATAFTFMDRLVLDPEENIYVWPGDSITLIHSPKTFSVFGATQNNNQLPFNAPRLSLAQAIARAGGLLDSRADPAGVFLFRFELPATVSAGAASASWQGSAPVVPTLYHLNLKEADSYFLAGKFFMQNDDIIYIAGASSNGAQKFFSLIGSLATPILGAAVLAK